MYTPEKHIVVDESLVPWRGRIVFLQYLPSKAHKYGVKVFKLCLASATCGLSLYMVVEQLLKDVMLISPKDLYRIDRKTKKQRTNFKHRQFLYELSIS